MNLKFTSIAVTTLAIFSITSCTVYLPPSEEPIPSADPIIIPEKKVNPKDLASVNTKKKPQSRQQQVFYVVKTKDTVFEVTRKTGVHWKEIIRLNNLKAPNYTIHPGQSLRIK